MTTFTLYGGAHPPSVQDLRARAATALTEAAKLENEQYKRLLALKLISADEFKSRALPPDVLASYERIDAVVMEFGLQRRQALWRAINCDCVLRGLGLAGINFGDLAPPSVGADSATMR